MEGMDAFRAANPERLGSLLEYISRVAEEDKAAREEYRRDDAAGFPNRSAFNPEASQPVHFNVSNGLITGCNVCGQTANLSRCGGCRVVSYCGKEHHSADWPAHKTYCSKIKKARTRLEAQGIALRVHPGDVDTPPDAFKKGGEGYGKFWGFKGTRPYMRSRYTLVDQLLQLHTVDAVKEALNHALEMLKLNANDNLGMQHFIRPFCCDLAATKSATTDSSTWSKEAIDTTSASRPNNASPSTKTLSSPS